MPRVLRNVSFLPLHALVVLLLLLGSAVRVTAAPAENDLFAEAESRYLGKNYTAAPIEQLSPTTRFPSGSLTCNTRRAVCLYRSDQGCRHHPSGGSSPTACLERASAR